MHISHGKGAFLWPKEIEATCCLANSYTSIFDNFIDVRSWIENKIEEIKCSNSQEGHLLRYRRSKLLISRK